MAAPRKFDWDEAARLRQCGMTYTAIGRALGVHYQSVRRALDPDVRARMDAAAKAWQTSGVCEECGAVGVTSAGYRRAAKHSSKDGLVLCRRCRWDLMRERLLFDAVGVLTAVRCSSRDCASGERWQPPENFTRGDSHREVRDGGIHDHCRQCQTRMRRDHRERNREATRAYDREYKRARRKASA